MTVEKKEEKKEEIKKAEEVVKEEVKEEPTINEDELNKAIQSLEDIVKARKKEEVEEEEEEEEEEEVEEKSYTGNFGENETLEKAIEVSDFLQALVDETETSVDALGKSIVFLAKSMEKFDTAYIGSLKQISDVLTKSFAGFDERLKKIEQTPIAAAPKTIRKAAEPIAKSFASGNAPEGVDALNKRQTVELMEKAIADGKIKDTVLFSYEGSPTFQLTEDTKEILKSYLPK